MHWNPSDASTTLYETALQLLRIGDLDGAWQVSDEGLTRTEGQPQLEEYWNLRFVRSEVLRHRGQTSEALAFLDALGLPPGQQVTSHSALIMHRAYCSAILGRVAEADALLERAALAARNLGLGELLGEITVRQAMVAYLRKKFSSARELYQSVHDADDGSFGWYLPCIARGGVGKSLMAMRQFEEALPWLEGAAHSAEAMGAQYLVASFSGEAAICHLGLGDSEKALQIHLVADSVLAALGARHAYQVNLADIGNVYLHRGAYNTAIDYYLRALAIARDINAPASIEKWSFNLQLAYVRLRASTVEHAKPEFR